MPGIARGPRVASSLTAWLMIASAAFPDREFAQSQRATGVHDSTGAPVVLGTDTLFRLYGQLGPFSPTSRAAAAGERIRGVAQSLRRGDSLTVTDRDVYSELSLGDLVLMTVLDDDAKPLGLPRPVVARQFAARVTTVATAIGDRSTARALLLDSAFAVIATVVLAIVLWVFSIVFPKLYRRIEALRRVHLPALRIQQFELLSAGRLSTLLIGLARVGRVVLTMILFYIYVPLALSFFPWTAGWSHLIVAYALRPFSAAWSAFIGYVPSLFYLAAGVIIVRYTLRAVHVLFDAVGKGAITIGGFYPDWSEPTYKIVRVLVLAFAIMALYPYLPGANSDAFKGVSLFIGVLFSLGSSAAIGNMVAGVVLTYTRAFQIGDRVKIADTVGDVLEKTLLVTRLRTIKNVAVTVPNSAVLASHIVNYTTLATERGLILHTSVTIGYDAPWRQVHELLLSAARRTPHILAEPAPFVLQTSLDDFYVSYEINAYTDLPDAMAVTYSRLHENIQEAFNEGGIEIMSPHYGALRDGNQTTIPPNYLESGYRAPAFRVERVVDETAPVNLEVGSNTK